MYLSAGEFSAILPLLIPALGACLLPLAALDKDQATVKWVRGAMFLMALFSLAGGFLYVARLWASGAQPTYGPLQMDRLGQFACIFTYVAAALAVLQLWDHLHQEGWVKGETLSLLLFSATGMVLFASSSNLILLFLGLELLSIPLYALTATVRTRPQAFEGGMKYFLTGAVAASCFLMGSVLLYGVTGSMELSTIGQFIGAARPDPLVLVGTALVLGGFLFKISAVPFHQWTPDVYEAAPHPITAFMSVATKAAAVLALLRVLGAGVPAPGALRIQSAVAVVAILTLVLGNLAALAQENIKRMLAYSSISHAGYLLLGVVAGTAEAYTGIIFYLAAYLAMNMGAFGLLSCFGLVGDRTTFDDVKGLGWKRPDLAVLATLCMFSLAGIPPLAGFYGKYMIFKELILQGHVGMAVAGVLASLVSVYYYLRLPVALFLDKRSEKAEREDAERPGFRAPLAGAALLVCGFLVVVMGLFPGTLYKGFAKRVVEDAFHIVR
ncbi:NADH-quinone oxidoreductase subunit N [Mesoterricola sediminis]|uniref:NADH-quinone oxidoreductase subunit N n=1 Tax=Mesoterricola sediminis TaxID=2927980 RepID=A0AA48H2Y6_9BACT|nr:NADH-quinone oxidoreductase subunit N [Mesoterricola sediminis]BDU78647.1 NADH-quinone oxidoreductase subunit N [Mesoterricola sediminis]